jgi:hypothetical protein
MAQPKITKGNGMTKATGEWKDTTVKANLFLTIVAEEGYLKRVAGYAEITSFTHRTDPTLSKQPIQKFYNDKGELLKPENIEAIKQRQ